MPLHRAFIGYCIIETTENHTRAAATTPGPVHPPTRTTGRQPALPEDSPLNLLADYARQGLLTLFVGAELPESATGLPNSHDLARLLRERYRPPVPQDAALPSVAQAIGRRGDLLRFLGEHLDTTGRTPQLFDRLLAQLRPIQLIVTTRYDDLIERAFDQVQRPLDVLASDVQVMLRSPDRTALIKLYGDLRQPTTITLTEDDIFDLGSSKRELMALVRQALVSTTALLIGHDLNSPVFQSLWRDVRRGLGSNMLRAYAVVETPFSQGERDMWLQRDVELIQAEPLALLHALAQRVPAWQSEPASPVSRTEPSPPAAPSPRQGDEDSGPQPPTGERPTAVAAPELPVASYRNFDLELSRADDRILVRVLSSPEGEGEAEAATFGEPPTLEGLEALDDLDEEIGRRLLPDAVGERWAANEATAHQAGEGLRLRLHIRDRALAAVPWEAANVRGKRLALRPQTPVVRYVRAGRPPGTLKVEGPLRVLVLLGPSQEINLEPLRTAAEQEELSRALQPLEEAGKLHITWLEGPITSRQLHDTLRHVQPHLLHFMGHGEYDEDARQGVLYLAQPGTNGTWKPDPLTTDDLTILLDGTLVRFALLNACQTGHAVGGIAEALVRTALPAALGMQASVPDRAAALFAGTFYRALADRWPVDAATVDGRKLLAVEFGSNTPWWALPVLYMRSKDGQLFT